MSNGAQLPTLEKFTTDYLSATKYQSHMPVNIVGDAKMAVDMYRRAEQGKQFRYDQLLAINDSQAWGLDEVLGVNVLTTAQILELPESDVICAAYGANPVAPGIYNAPWQKVQMGKKTRLMLNAGMGFWCDGLGTTQPWRLRVWHPEQETVPPWESNETYLALQKSKNED